MDFIIGLVIMGAIFYIALFLGGLVLNILLVFLVSIGALIGWVFKKISGRE